MIRNNKQVATIGVATCRATSAVTCTATSAASAGIVAGCARRPMPSNDPRFPSIPQAIAIALALLLVQWLGAGVAAAVWSSADGPTVTVRVAGALLGDVLLALALTRHLGLGMREVFHPGTASAAATAGVLLPLVLLVTPLYAMAAALLLDQVEQWWPPSDAEREMFRALAPDGVPMLLLLCVAAPVLEEWVFRGLILRGFLARYRPGPALWASAALFGASHLNLYQGLAGLLLGLVTGWLYLRSRSLIPGIGLHAGYNAMLVAMDALSDPALGDDAPLWTPPLAGWICFVLLAAAGWHGLRRWLPTAPR